MAVSKIKPVETGTIVSAVEQWLDDNISGGQTIAVDSSLSVAGAAAESKTVGDRFTTVEGSVSDLKTAFGKSTGNTIVEMTGGGYIPCNMSTGIDVTVVTSNSNYRHAAVACTAGDKFTVSAKGATVGRAWCFIDADGVRLSVASSGETVTDLVLTAPASSAYLIINDNNTGAVSYYGVAIKDVVALNKADTVYNYNRTGIPTDCDSVTANSIYYIQTADTIANLPDDITSTFQAGWLMTIYRSSSNILQIFIPSTIAGVVYTRRKASNSWARWMNFSALARGQYADIYGSLTYKFGDYTQYGDTVYRNIAYIPVAEAFDPTKWEAVKILNELSGLMQDYYNTSSISLFKKIGCCGDSFTAGYLYNKENSAFYDPNYVPDGTYPQVSWPSVLGRLYGVTTNNFSKAGATTKSYLTTSQCLPAALAADPQDLYILCLGLNDYSQSVTLGTIDDIHDSDYTQNPDTYYGNYGRIIQQLMNHAPLAKFVIVKCFWVLRAGDHATLPYTKTNYYDYMDDSVEAIADHYGFPFIETMNDPFFCGKPYVDGLKGLHPTAPLYAGMAKRLGQLIDKCVIDNPSYFFNFYIPDS